MAIGNISNFGTFFTKNKKSGEIMQHTADSAAEDIQSFFIGDTYYSKFTRQWIEVRVSGRTVYLGLDFAAINCDCNTLLSLHSQQDYVDKKELKNIILTEEEWTSIPAEYIEQIDWATYPGMYTITNSMEDNKIVWLRYEDGAWIRRVWGTPGVDINPFYVNGFIPVLYDGPDAWNESEDSKEKYFDLGVQHRPFAMRYTVSDLDNQTISVTERLNGKVINQIENFDKNKYGTLKITQQLFDTLELITQNVIEIEASDGMQSDIFFITFRKTNNLPYIINNSTDLGTIVDKPVIKYRAIDPDGDKLTIIEKINGVQIRSFTTTNNIEYTVQIPDDFWNNCGTGVSTVEIYAIDSFGATCKSETTFEKAVADVVYTVFYAVEGDKRYERVFESSEGKEEVRWYTYSYTTINKNMDFDIKNLPKDTEINVWVVAHNSYASSKYKSSNILTFKKSTYGKPIVGIPESGTNLSQSHSEYGYLHILYLHEDVEYADGVCISKDPDRPIEDFKGEIEIHYYIDGKYGGIYPIEDKNIMAGETRNFEIDFGSICSSRSCKITYFVKITDLVSKESSSNKTTHSIGPEDMIAGHHYYNDEPKDPKVKHDYIKDFIDNELEYGFKYINIYWNNLVDSDGDNSVYYVYLRTPKQLNEDIYVTTVNDRQGPNVIEYNREYKIEEVYDEGRNVVGSKAYYYNNETKEYIEIQENNFLGLSIRYTAEEDHLGREWPEKEEFSFVVVAKDTREWDNSYFGMYDSNDYNFVYAKRAHVYPNDVEVTVMPNIIDALSDGEKGRVTMKYSHPEILEMPGTVDLYAYQDGQLIAKVYSGEFYPNEEQTITIDFTMFEYETETGKTLKRSKDITYYAVAKDAVGLTSLGKYSGLSLEYIPYIVPDEDGNYGYYIVNINGVTLDFNDSTFNYKGPVQVGKHYFNEEPPAVTPTEYDPLFIGYDNVVIKWPHVEDPDGDEVRYEVYVANSVNSFNTETKEFFNDNQPDGNDYVEGEENRRAIVSTILGYHKVIEIPASVAAEYSQKLEISVTEYQDDSDINVWIVSKDPYVNSYYRSGEIVHLAKGHEAKEIRTSYPSNGSVVYAKTPRILIYLGEDNMDQTVYVQWKEETYNNREHPEYFSSEPNKDDIMIFKPPVPFTEVSGNEVTYSVWVHNRCTYGPKSYYTYTYKNFFDNLYDEKLIPIKSNHINLFREAIDVTRKAYGMDPAKYSRTVRKDMLFENIDFNETKNAIMDVNNKINNADKSEGLDHVNPLIVDLKDLDLVEYEGSVAAGSYEEFLEWARLLYILENL